MDHRDKILQLVRSRGPLLPIDVAKLLNTNLLMASAMLSELVTKKHLKVSSLKIGSSPLYLQPGQEVQLERYSDKLGEKDHRAYEKLKTERVLRDRALDPLTRVCLRQIKDFAVPLDVSIGEDQEIFWKWHALPDEKVEERIRDILGISQESAQAPNVEAKEAQSPPSTPPITPPDSTLRAQKAKLQDEIDAKRKEMEAQLRKEREQLEAERQRLAEEKENLRREALENKERQEKQATERTAGGKQDARPEPTPSSPPSTHATKKKNQKEKQDPPQEDTAKRAPSKPKTQADPSDPFFNKLVTYFKKQGIKLISKECIRKNSEYAFTVEMPTPLGPLTCYINAKNKKRLTEGDFSTAYIKGQSRKLPTVLLSPGKPSKNALNLLAQDLKGMVFKELN